MSDTQSWDRSADVVVVGAGGAGLAAAVSAAESEVSVLVLEKEPHLGGTTGVAVGSFTAANTSMQRAQGIEDGPIEHDQDMAKFAGEREPRNNVELRRLFARRAPQVFEWLRGMGLEFHGPNPEPPNRVPRMHNVIPNAKAYIVNMQRAARRHGATFETQCRVTELVRNDAGRVIGVEAEARGRPLRIQARRGVVLAAGDYSHGLELKRQFLPAEIADVEGINESSTGDGHRLGQDAGGKLVNMDVVYGPEIRFVPPPRPPISQWLPAGRFSGKVFGRLMPLVPKPILNHFIRKLLVTWQHPEPTLFRQGAILVNREGARFANELAQPELALPRQPDRIGYIVMDDQIAARLQKWPNFISTAPDIAYAYLADYKRDRRDIYWEAPSLEGLAEKLGMSSALLEQAVFEYNHGVSGHNADPFGRKPLRCLVGRAAVLRLGPGQVLHRHDGKAVCALTIWPAYSMPTVGRSRDYLPPARRGWGARSFGATVCTSPGQSPAAGWPVSMLPSAPDDQSAFPSRGATILGGKSRRARAAEWKVEAGAPNERDPTGRFPRHLAIAA